MIGPAHIVFIVAALAMPGAQAQTPEPAVRPLTWQKLFLGPAGATYAFPVYSNHGPGDGMARISRVLLVQHGRARNGDAYFLEAQNLMRKLGIDPQETLLISPQFFSPAQTAKAMLTDFPAWGTGGFAGGEDSVSPPGSVSSFQVYDDLLALLTDRKRFPALRRIVLAGHSGGAVLVQQFAALNRFDEKVRAAGIEIRYVVANSSAFLYFNDQRPSGDGFSAYDSVLCPTYNDHRYGFSKIVRYAMSDAPAEVYRRYMERR